MDDPVADLHIHSCYSHDSFLTPRTILKRAKAAGLSCIAITDHGTIRGGIEVQKSACNYAIEVIVGTEIRTDYGDIIGFCLENEIQATRWDDVIADIKNQNGIVVLPHPYRDHVAVDQIAQKADFIEIWNARSTQEQNAFAANLAKRFSKPGIFGSDAHVSSEIGSVKTQIDRATLRCKKVLCTRPSTADEIQRSQIISLVKQRKWGTLISQGTRYMSKKIRHYYNNW
jgi:predicted metal-dependent phosphoesterase TrpH